MVGKFKSLNNTNFIPSSRVQLIFVRSQDKQKSNRRSIEISGVCLRLLFSSIPFRTSPCWMHKLLDALMRGWDIWDSPGIPLNTSPWYTNLISGVINHFSILPFHLTAIELKSNINLGAETYSGLITTMSGCDFY